MPHIWTAFIPVDHVSGDEMSARTKPASRTDAAPPAIPETITASESKLVYLYLRTSDDPTVDELHRNLGVRKLTLFPVLDTLRERGLIDETDVADWGNA